MIVRDTPRRASKRCLSPAKRRLAATWLRRLGAVAAVLCVLIAIAPSGSAPAQAAPPLPSKDVLERQKLVQEIEKLRQENQNEENFFERNAALITALVALGGLLATLWKQNSDQRLQRERDRDQRSVELERRLEDRFATNLSDLRAAEAAKQAGAAASLVTYLRPEHERFRRQVRIAALTNLKVEHKEPIRKLLGRLYADSLASGTSADAFERDLSRAQLALTDLSGLELQGADLGFADLRSSTLVGCDLYRARGFGVNLTGAHCNSIDDRVTSLVEVRFHNAKAQAADFSGALLVNAHLRGADLREARFYRAHLQAAHLEHTKLQGASFQGANLDDTYFYQAEFDESALASIARALNWRNAHFDWDVLELLHAREDQQ